MRLTRMFLFSVMTTLPFSAVAMTLTEVDFELRTIDEYQKQGIGGDELNQRKKTLLKEKALLTKQKKVEVKKKASVGQLKAVKKHDTIDYLGDIKKIEKDEDKLLKIFSRIEEQRHLLAQEIEKEDPSEKFIAELRNRIDLLEWKKSVVQKRLSSLHLRDQNSALKLSGMIDVYYGRSSNRGGNNGSADRTEYHNTLRYYDNKHNDFTVNLVEVTLSGTKSRTSYLVDLDFGEFAEQNAPGDEISKHIGQAIVTYDFDGKHTVSVGKMYSHVGYELAKSQDNWNYSRPFAFGFGIPFWHEGVAIKGAYASGFRWGAFVYDRTDAHLANSLDKSYGLQLGHIGERSSLIYNLITGPDQNGKEGNKRTIHNVNGQLNFSGATSVAIDLVKGSDQDNAGLGKDQGWESVVGYLNHKVSDTWRIALRSEWLGETTDAGVGGNYRLGVDGSVTGPVDITTQTITLAHNIEAGNEVRLEYRLDHANNPIFWNRDNHLRDQQDTMVIAWLLKI